MPYILGVDGGNTKTIALVASLDGTIIGAGRGGFGDIYNSFGASTRGLTSEQAAIVNIEHAVKQALQQAQVAPDELVAAVFNLSGADWPEDFELLHAEMQARHFGQTIVIQNDALGILHAGSLENIGVSVVCGTGATTGARGPDGTIWHASFWQGPQGGVELGAKALNTVVRADLGLEEPTNLTERVLKFFGMGSVEQILHYLTNRDAKNHGAPRIDSLTPILFDEADAGDAVARRVIQQHGQALGDYAIVGARKVGIEHSAYPLVLAGGVLRHSSPLLADAIIKRVRQASPDVQPTRAYYEPIIGVLFGALDISGTPITAAIRAQLLATQPDSALFDTITRSPLHPDHP
ncbi:N-acetylglucosamine kinase [Dictyobacter sp. S3.2.2.5]|uniref:N-acetylglucosamine kinase n=1 Tax=Dictyobacter halimunensis TaxID=3026934 RepID=A0ABQ6FRI3_9CHLR|nr:N-acetylglucosamine kinase [Dictyobacter sp. S3.2.2.5]